MKQDHEQMHQTLICNGCCIANDPELLESLKAVKVHRRGGGFQ